jgi:hypothetical protein
MPTTVGFGVSDTLRSIFEGLSQAEGSFGQKYSDKDINKVRQYVSCRNYSKASLELVYLCWAIVHAYPARRNITAIEAFFWLDEAHTASRCRAVFSQGWQGKAGQVEINKDYLSLVVGHKKFTISPSRVSVLAVLMEFIVTVDPSFVLILQNRLFEATVKDIEQLATQIQHSIYQFLKQHMPEAQIQTRYRYFESWLRRNALNINTLDDQAIMTFWQDAGNDEQAQSYVLYATALFDVLDALSAMDIVASQQAVSFAQRFGHDDDSHELKPEHIVASHLDEETGENLQALAFPEQSDNVNVNLLCQAPKCLTQEEALSLQPLVEYQPFISRFLRSFLRLQIFAKWQAVLVQAKRKSAHTVFEKLKELPVQGYAMYELEMSGISNTLSDAKNCLLAVLLELEPEFGCIEALHTMPPEQLPAIAAWLAKQRKEQSHWPSLINQLNLQFGPFRHAVDSFKHALKANHKAGFKTPPALDESEKYQESYQLVLQVSLLIKTHLKDMQKMSQQDSLSGIFASDVCIFTSRFNTLYGGSIADQ